MLAGHDIPTIVRRRRAVAARAALIAVAAVGLSLHPGWAGPARAAEPAGKSDARDHFEKAETLFKLERYKEALSEYEQGYVSRPDPVFLYNIGQCYRLMGDKESAIRFYRRFLSENPPEKARAAAEQRIAELEQTGPLAPPPPSTAPSTPGAAPPAVEPPPPATPPGPTTATTTSALTAPPVPPPPAPTPSPAPEPLAAPAPPPSLIVTSEPVPPPRPAADEGTSSHWWVWAVVGAVVVGAAAIVVAASQGGDPACPARRTCQ